MYVISYGEPSLYANIDDRKITLSRGRCRDYDDCDYDCNSDCSNDWGFCPCDEDDCDCHCPTD